MTPITLIGEQRRLIDGWQRRLPLEPRPFAAIGDAIGASESDVIRIVKELAATGVISRVGATISPNTVGASLLAAMRVEPEKLEEIAAIVSGDPCVNHNYEREHDFNLWFVVTAADRSALASALARLRAATGHDCLELPMERAYYLDLGFPIDMSGRKTEPVASAREATFEAGDADLSLLHALEDGLAITPRPYADLGQRCEATEDQVIARLARLLASGIISRLGVIVRHRALGITANAMAVWDIDDDKVNDVGTDFAAVPFVTLCYRRPRRLPSWRYNLFTMVHGRDRATVEAQVAELAARASISPDRRAVLFSKRCFTQRGARYKAA